MMIPMLAPLVQQLPFALVVSRTVLTIAPWRLPRLPLSVAD